MIRIILPGDGRRATLRAFWLSLSLFVGCLVALGARWAQARYPWAAGGAAAALFFGMALIDEALAWRVYRAWNRFLARPIARAIQRLTLRLCFFIIRAAALAGRPDMRLTPAKPGPGWSTRTSLPRERYEDLFFAATGAFGSDRRGQYRRWAAHSGHGWALALLPFLALLRWVDPEEEKATAANIYTLF
jgi:hypothetical protein